MDDIKRLIELISGRVATDDEAAEVRNLLNSWLASQQSVISKAVNNQNVRDTETGAY